MCACVDTMFSVVYFHRSQKLKGFQIHITHHAHYIHQSIDCLFFWTLFQYADIIIILMCLSETTILRLQNNKKENTDLKINIYKRIKHIRHATSMSSIEAFISRANMNETLHIELSIIFFFFYL